MKSKLTSIFELMKKIETKGESTMFMADCLMALADVINNMPDDEVKESEPCQK